MRLVRVKRPQSPGDAARERRLQRRRQRDGALGQRAHVLGAGAAARAAAAAAPHAVLHLAAELEVVRAALQVAGNDGGGCRFDSMPGPGLLILIIYLIVYCTNITYFTNSLLIFLWGTLHLFRGKHTDKVFALCSLFSYIHTLQLFSIFSDVFGIENRFFMDFVE